jgi:hypothetical protein
VEVVAEVSGGDLRRRFEGGIEKLFAQGRGADGVVARIFVEVSFTCTCRA